MTQKEIYINKIKLSPNSSTYYKIDYIGKYFPEVYEELSKDGYTKESLYNLIYNETDICPLCGRKRKFLGMIRGYKNCDCDQTGDPYKTLLNSKNANQFRESYVQSHFPVFYNEILKEYNEDISWRERLYMKLHHMSEPNRCKVCGNYTSFINHTEGYLKTCSYKCANNDPEANEKRVKTNLEKYGTTCVLSNEDVKEKGKRTNLERCGFEYRMQNDEHKIRVLNTIKERYGGIGNASKSIREKQESTMLKEYGVINSSQIESNREKLRLNCPLNTPESHVKAKIGKQKRIQNDLDDVLGFTSNCGFKDETGWICKCPHPECNKCSEKTYITYSQLYRDRLRDGTELCTKLLPFNISRNKNTTIELFIHNILDELGIEYNTNDFKLIYPKELDIYIPSKKIAIECNGIYWHSSINKENSYHMNKYKTCAGMGIQLITIWEDWIRNSPDLIKSMIWSKLGIYKERIGARQCSIKKVNAKESNEFLNENHIQGEVKGKVRYGLYYKNELVSVMVFSKKQNYWELVRFSTKKYMQIISGAEKLFKKFIKEYSPTEVISFSCNDISKGNLYNKLGFDSDKLNSCYWYIHKSFKRYHHSRFSKQEIVKIGWKDKIDDSWTEWEVMDNHADEYLRIHDSGQIRWVWKKEP